MTRAWKTKTFARWARRARLDDAALRRAVNEIDRALIDAALGGDLIKKRVARSGGGKSGGYRTIIAVRAGKRAFFIEGFAKSRRANIDDGELAALKRLAEVLLSLNEAALDRAMKLGELVEIGQ